MYKYPSQGNYQFYIMTAREMLGIRPAIVDIYRDAFASPPYNEGETETLIFAETLVRHADREGFRCVAARSEQEERWIGFGYGYTSKPGYFWWDQVAPALSLDQVEMWLRDCFEMVELAVLSDYQRKGIGSHLHDLLLDGLSHCTAALSTRPGTPAEGMYSKKGWVILLDHYIFPGGTDPYTIMGLDLMGRKKEEG